MAEERAASGRQEPDRDAPEEPRLASVAGAMTDTSPLELDQLIHERVRLGIVSALAVNDTLAFTELRDLLETTDGNLSAHARRLEEAGYLECTKSFVRRVPHTEYRLTATGRKELDRYLEHMEALIRATRDG